MKPEQREYVEYRLSRAGEALKAARLLLDGGHLHSAISRMYYACFYAASALLLVEGYSSSKHSGLLALFDLHWMKPERLPRDLSRIYHGLFDRRQEADYGDAVFFEAGEAEARLTQAEEFVRVVSEKTREMIEET